MANNELMRPAEVEFSQFTATLIAETLDAIIEAQLDQEEKIRELEEIAELDDIRFAEEIINVEDVEEEMARLFPSAERICSVTEGSPYTPQERGKEENPAIRKTTGYAILDEDWKRIDQGATITQAGYQHIFNHVRTSIAKKQLANILQLAHRGIPRVIVDHGRVNTKLTFQLSQVKRAGAPKVTPATRLQPGALSRLKKPYALRVKPVDLRRPELLRPSVNLVGEVEITFKTVSE